jgi:hypothetical protein
VGVFNWNSFDQPFDVSLAHIGLPLTNYVGFDFWSNALVSISGNLQLTVPAESCCILAVRPVSNRPQILSTSRHVTQGIVDVLAETWSEGTRTLNGRSLVVGGDAYELRIVVPDNTWEATSATVSSADQAAGVTATFAQTGNLVRATVSTDTNRTVAWTVSFSGPPTQRPTISDVAQNGGNLVIAGTQGIWNGQYYLLTSTNLNLPLANWTIAGSNFFDENGNFRLTNAIPPGARQSFYCVALP